MKPRRASPDASAMTRRSRERLSKRPGTRSCRGRKPLPRAYGDCFTPTGKYSLRAMFG